MIEHTPPPAPDLAQRLSEAEATIRALLSGQIDAVIDPHSLAPVLLSKAHEALRESEERYRQIVETTSDGILNVTDDAMIVFVNRRFAEMLGYEPGELIGTSVFAIMSVAARETAIEQIRRPGHGTIDTTFRHKGGTEVAVSIAVSRLVDGDGRSVGSLGVVRDVTERKKLQSQLMVSDRMASVGTLAAGVAHEINNPLAAVMANLDFVAEVVGRARDGDAGPADPALSHAWLVEQIQEPLADAREAADRVRLIVRDLKIFSRSPTAEAKAPVAVNAVMESSLRMAWNEIRHRARLVKHYGAVPEVEANEARLGQVFLNLTVNAAQALQEGRAERNEIHVCTRLDGERVVIEVSDNGPGIPPEIIGSIFDAFFTTKPVGAGTGLGLAICQRIVSDMAGELTVESEVGKGTTFRVALPVAREDARPNAAPRAPAPVVGRRGRILVVDDEPMVLRAVKRCLASEHEVVTTSSASEALALCVGGAAFDLIFCDLMMPVMTGMDLHRELRDLAPEHASKMIFLTGGAFTAAARRFLAEAAREHIEKPFDPVNLRALVRRYLR